MEEYLLGNVELRLKENYYVEPEEILEHSKKVKEIALEISEQLGISPRNKQLIEKAALLHDIEKLKKKDDDHNKRGAVFAYENRNKLLSDCNEDEVKLICLMIRAHKGKYRHCIEKITENQLQLMEVVRAADKISKIYKKELKKVINDIEEGIDNLNNQNVKEVATEVLANRIRKL